MIKLLPNSTHSPNGGSFEAKPGESVLEVLLRNRIAVEHACEMQCACTTCHLYIRKGAQTLSEPSTKEEDMLDRAWGLDMDSRLGCQARLGESDITVEIPKYTINQVSERYHDDQ